MSAVSALPAQIVQWLSGREHLTDITFLTEFPAVKKAVPLKKNIVAIGLSCVTITDKFKDDGNGVLVAQEYCRSADMRISLAVHVPFSRGGHTCHDVFSRIMDTLSFSSDLHITESGCGQIAADRDTDALVLKGYIDISADFCPAETGDHVFASFFDKELLCGTHIRDGEIHVTTADKDRWNNPIQIGQFIGTGSGTRTISLGYTPRFVSVYASEYPYAEYDSTEGKTMVYAGIATQGRGSLGLEIISGGFRLQNSNVSYGASTPRLNAAGDIYGYVAIK